MSSDDADLFTQLLLGEPTLAALTESAVARALDGFDLTPRRKMSWIARAVQGAVYASMLPADESPDRRSNSEVRDEILKLSGECSRMRDRLWQRSQEADRAIWDRAVDTWTAAADPKLQSVQIGPPADYKDFSEALRQLDWLSNYLRSVAAVLHAQPPNWRRAEEREQRVVRAQFLSPIYEEAFGREPTVNTWPMAKSLGPWADFYQRIVALAFGEQATPNLEAVLDEARRRHKTRRVTFGAGVISN